VGNEVALIKGIDWPVVLRFARIKQVEGKGEKRSFQLPGQCYVGELIGKDFDWEQAKEIYLV
jgi:hypothetical protein